jgi:hypothetical protein
MMGKNMSTRGRKPGRRNQNKKKKIDGGKRPPLILGPSGSMVVSDRLQYVDTIVNGTVTTTGVTGSLLANLAALYASFPQSTTPVMINGTAQWVSAVTVTHIDIQWKFVGSQETTLVNADLYNTMRGIVYYTDNHTGEAPVSPLVGTDQQLDLQDVAEIYCDHNKVLPSQASESAVNVPDLWIGRVQRPVNRAFDWYTTVAAGTSNWFTRRGDIYYAVISDSSIIPSPTFFLSARVFFQARYRR